MNLYHENYERERHARVVAIKVKNLAEERMKKIERDMKELRDRLNQQAARRLREDQVYGNASFNDDPLPDSIWLVFRFSMMISKGQMSIGNQVNIDFQDHSHHSQSLIDLGGRSQDACQGATHTRGASRNPPSRFVTVAAVHAPGTVPRSPAHSTPNGTLPSNHSWGGSINFG